MFFSTDLLLPWKKRRLAIIWLASIFKESEFKQKFGKKEVVKVDICVVSEEVLEVMRKDSDDPKERFSLYLSAQLVLGMTRICKYQKQYLKSDIVKLHKYLKRMMKDLHKVASDESDSGIDQIEIPADVPDFELNVVDVSDIRDVHRIEEPPLPFLGTSLARLDSNFGQLKEDEVIRLFGDQSLRDADIGEIRAFPYDKDASSRSDLPMVSIEDIDASKRRSAIPDVNISLPGTPQKRAATRESVTDGTPTKRKRIVESLKEAKTLEPQSLFPQEEPQENFEVHQLPLEDPPNEDANKLGVDQVETRAEGAVEDSRKFPALSVTLGSVLPRVVPSRKSRNAKKGFFQKNDISIDLENLGIATSGRNEVSSNYPEYLLESAQQLQTIQNFLDRIIGFPWQVAIDENDLIVGLRKTFESKTYREETVLDSVDTSEEVARDVTGGITLDPSSSSRLANIDESKGVEGDKTLANITESEAIPAPIDLVPVAPELPPGEFSEVREDLDILKPVEEESIEIDKFLEKPPTPERTPPRDSRLPAEPISESLWVKRDFEAQLDILFSMKHRVKFSEIVHPEDNSKLDAVVCSGFVAELYEKKKIDIVQENLETDELELEKFRKDF